MDMLFSSRVRRRCLVLPTKWNRRCSVLGCTIPLWPPGENLDEDGHNKRIGSDDMIQRDVSFNQICFLCQAVFCRYHLSPLIDFVARWSHDFQQDKWYPPKTRLCAKCLLKIDIEYIEWQNSRLLKGENK